MNSFLTSINICSYLFILPVADNYTMELSVLIADDHFPVRFGLEVLLKRVLGENIKTDFAVNSFEVIKKISNNNYDILVTDIAMPGMDCLDMVEKVLTERPLLKILVVSVYSGDFFARRYMKQGVYGYVSKSDSDEVLKNAIRHIYLGKRFFPSIERGTNALLETNSLFDMLSNREFSIMMLLLRKKDIKEISVALALSPSTVSTYKGRLFEKLKINSLIELADLARMNNIPIYE